jgi:phage terminase small subunit
MGKGGARPGAGRKPDPNSARQQKLAARLARATQGFTGPDGVRSADAPAEWAFGTKTPAPAATTPAAPPPVVQGDALTAVALLRRVYQDETEDLKVRLQAAALAAPFESPKLAPITKKEPKPEKAAPSSRFASKAPPKLVVNNKV